jgi:hypothetical protein
MVARPNQMPGVSLAVPANLQHWYNGTTTVQLPCGIKVQPAEHTFLKYNACAFEGETVTTPMAASSPTSFGWATPIRQSAPSADRAASTST